MSSIPPVINYVQCESTGSQPVWFVSWQISGYDPPVTVFWVGLFDSTGALVGAPQQAYGAAAPAFQAPQPIVAANAYYIKVAVDVNGQPGPWPGNGVPALFVAPTNFAVAYDGTNISASWTNPPAGLLPAGGQVALVASSGITVTFELSGTAGSFAPGPLDPTMTYTLNVVPENSSGYGPPSGSVNLIQTRLPALYVDNPGGNARSVGVPAQSGNPPTLGVTCFLDGVAVQSMAVPSQLQTLDNVGFWVAPFAIANPIIPGGDYRFAAQLYGASSIGPLGPTGPLLQGTPVVESVMFAPQQPKDQVAVSVSLPPGSPQVTGFRANVIDGSGTSYGAGSFTGSSGVITCDGKLQVGGAYLLRARALLGLSLGPPAAIAPKLLTSFVTVTQAGYDGATLSAKWSAPADAGITGYRMLAIDAHGGVLAQLDTADTQGALALPPGSSGGLSVAVQSLGDSGVGPLGTGLGIIASSPTVTATAYDGANLTVTWRAVADTAASGYSIQLLLGGQPSGAAVTVDGASITTKTMAVGALSAAGGYSVTVRAIGTVSATPTTTGPSSAPARVSTAVVRPTSVSYDGANVTVAWLPSATGYRLSLWLAGTVSASADTSGTSATLPLAATSTGSYQVSVQAVEGIAVGPATLPLAAVPAGFSLSPSGPQILPGSSALPQAPFVLTAYLPELYSTPPATLPSAPPFTLTASATTGAFKYTLTFAADSAVWSFTDTSPIRAAIQTAYIAFIGAMESNGTLLPGAVQTVQRAIARLIPQTFTETLYYSYGFVAANDYIDLRPGMRLRVEYQQFQNVGANPPAYVNGYVGSNFTEYDVGSYFDGAGNLRVGFDAFLSNLQGVLVPPPQGGGAGPCSGGGGVIDFYYSPFPQPFYRLLYPSTFLSTNNGGSGYLSDNVAVASSSTWGGLGAATTAWQAAAPGSHVPSTPVYSITYLRGRATLTPLIQASVNGTPVWTPVGTTVAQLLERAAARPLALAGAWRGLRYTRSLDALVLDPAAAATLGQSWPVRFDWGAAVYPGGADWTSLPALHGDALHLG